MLEGKVKRNNRRWQEYLKEYSKSIRNANGSPRVFCSEINSNARGLHDECEVYIVVNN